MPSSSSHPSLVGNSSSSLIPLLAHTDPEKLEDLQIGTSTAKIVLNLSAHTCLLFG